MLERKVHRRESLCSRTALEVGGWESHMEATLPHCCMEGKRAAEQKECHIKVSERWAMSFPSPLFCCGRPMEGRRSAGSPLLWDGLLKRLPPPVCHIVSTCDLSITLMFVQMQGPSRRLETQPVEQALSCQDNRAGLHRPQLPCCCSMVPFAQWAWGSAQATSARLPKSYWRWLPLVEYSVWFWDAILQNSLMEYNIQLQIGMSVSRLLFFGSRKPEFRCLVSLF